MQINGSLDRCDVELVEGWIILLDQPETKVRLDILLDGQVIGHCVADQFRQDLKDGGLGDGTCAFRFRMPLIPKRKEANIAVRLEDVPIFLQNPRTVSLMPEAVVPPRETVSRFGGLWVDRYDWLDQLALKHRTNEISEELSVAIFRFVRDGYLTIENAVPQPSVDRLNEDIERLWQDPPEGLLIETFEYDGKLRYIPADVQYREGQTKLLDVYGYSTVARAAIAAPKVMEFLTAIFEDRPKAFQSLHFCNGAPQAMSKDTAYVKVDSNPMHLAATWLALEDVEPGTGELEYYVGSHRAPDFLFGGFSKWMESSAGEHERFLQSLHDDAVRYAHVRSSFLAKRGDVLIWHADLAHGRASTTVPGQSQFCR